MENQKVVWSDKMGSRSRKAWLLLVTAEGKVIVFTNKNISGVAVIRGDVFKKDGKWSHTTYRLEIATGVRAIPGHDGFETGKFVEGLQEAIRRRNPINTWAEVAEALGVSVESAQEFLRAWRAKAAEALDAASVSL